MNQGVSEPESVQRKDVQSFPGFALQGRHFLVLNQTFGFFFQFFSQKGITLQIYLYLCNCYLPNVAVMHIEVCGAAGWSTTY
jgi:hypothetical protein